MKSLIKLLIWYPITILTLIFTIYTYQVYFLTTNTPGLIRQKVLGATTSRGISFAALPKTSFEIKTAFATRDARPVIIEKYFAHYNSPMAGLGEFIVQTAEKNEVDPYLIVAIAQQESNLGKLMPDNCYNAWGWGIHSAGTLCFNNWNEAINTYAEGLSKSYHAYNLYTPDEIMTKYVPHSPGGAWAKGVNQFLAELQTGDF